MAKASPDWLSEARALYAEGLGVSAIARQLNIPSRQLVHYHLCDGNRKRPQLVMTAELLEKQKARMRKWHSKRFLRELLR